MTGRQPWLDRSVRSVAAEGACFGLRPDASAKSYRTLVGCIRSVLTYADVGRTEETLTDWMLGESGRENSRLEPYWKRPDDEVQRPVTF